MGKNLIIFIKSHLTVGREYTGESYALTGDEPASSVNNVG